MRRRYLESAIGAFVIVIAAWFLLYAYASSDLRSVDGYLLKAKFNSIGGLAPGNDVRIGGVKIGSVTAQRIDAQDFRAEISFTVRSDLKLPEDSVAVVASDGLLGGKYLRLEPGRAKQTLAPGSELRKSRDALSLEDMLGKAIFLLSEEPKEK